MVWLCACLIDGALYRERRAQLADDDGDHWTEAAGDCNDAEADVHPEAPDICNHTDDDCDGSVDEDIPTWFLDHDEDGVGDATTAVATCDKPGGFVDNADDCNDDDPALHPGAPEACNGYDDDCDDLIDGADDGLEGGIELYTDADEDGFGDDATEHLGCPGEKDTVDIGGDCDDSTQTVHPGATPEICWDGVDTDCDGNALGCSGWAEDANAGFFGESAGDEASLQIASRVDLDRDGYTELLVGARSDDDGAADAGAAYVIRGPVSAGMHDLSAATTKLTGGAAGDRAGRTVAFAGDLDGDGTQDIVVSAPLRDSTGTDAGTVYLIADTSLASGSTGLDGLEWAGIHGDHQYDYFGNGFLGLVDVNDDDVDDLWICASGDDSGGDAAGAVFLVLGPLNDATSLGGSHAAEITGEVAGRNVGTVLGGGDFDGDGYDDLAIGDRFDNASGYLSGAVSVFAGPVSGTAVISTADAKVLSDGIGHSLGISIAGAEDLDGDGRDDFVAGAPVAGTTGEAYLFEGVSTLSLLSGHASAVASAIFESGATDVNSVGGSVAAGGDFDVDGEGDFLVGASTSGTSSHGAVFLVFGPVSGFVPLDEGGGRIGFRLDGDAANDALGTGVAFTGPIAADASEGAMLSSSTLDTSDTDAGGSYLVWAVGL